MSDSIHKTNDGQPIGLRRAGRLVDTDDLEIIDAIAGRTSVLGFGSEPIIQAITNVTQTYLGDANSPADPIKDSDDSFITALRDLIDGSSSVLAESAVLCESADVAVETSIRFARSWKKDAFRTVALIGSDHGRTAACRTASGIPDLHEGYGPMMAGFAHVPANDIDALKATVDERTACLLLCPIDLHDACLPLDTEYLKAAREICDQHQVALIFDESRLCFGGSGKPFTFSSIAEVRADAVVLSAGIFAGLPGGIFVGSDRLTQSTLCQSDHLPLQRAVAMATFSEMQSADLPSSTDEEIQEIAVKLAETIGGFEFVRDIHASGSTIGIVTDIRSDEIVQAAASQGLKIEAAGDTAIRMQLPLLVDENDASEMLQRFAQTMQEIEREAADPVQG